MLTLPPLPTTVRLPSPRDSERLQRMYPSLWMNPATKCITCAKTGTFLSAEGETECDCKAQWRLHLFLLNSGVLLSYQRLTWRDLDDQIPQHIWAAMDDYSSNADANINAGLGLILSGPNGTGKTLLSSLLFKRLLGAGHDGYFTQFNHLLDAYTAGWQDREDRDWFMRRVANAGVLVIDDIGKESKGRENVTTPLLDSVIRSRVADDKPTIITTNYTMSEMQSGYGGAAMSLLAEACFDHQVTGMDFRPRARERQLAEAREGIVRPVTLG